MADPFDISLRVAESRAKRMLHHMDMLYKKGQADKWDKPVMDYIMWIEHEMSSNVAGLQRDLIDIRKNRKNSSGN